MDKTEFFYWCIWWGWWVVQFVLYTLLGALMCDGFYQIIVSLRGFWNQKKMPPAKRYRRFAVLVPAHNEEAVLSPLLDSLACQNYPKNCYKVYVSCDNCTDGTAALARSKGAVALERFDDEHNGKTWNVRWALTQIPLDDYDALTMFDADNLAERNFLMAMNNYMELHPDAEAIQGVLDVKNPDDNWLTRSYAMAYWFTNRFWQLARGLWGLSCTLGGTGLVIRMATLERVGWNLQSLTEDLEMSTRLILSGSRVHWNDAAVIYDEKPQDMRISVRQRTRWMQGHYWVFWHYGRPALKSFLTTGRLQLPLSARAREGVPRHRSHDRRHGLHAYQQHGALSLGGRSAHDDRLGALLRAAGRLDNSLLPALRDSGAVVPRAPVYAALREVHALVLLVWPHVDSDTLPRRLPREGPGQMGQDGTHARHISRRSEKITAR